MLTLQGRFDDHDVAKVAERAACGLLQAKAGGEITASPLHERAKATSPIRRARIAAATRGVAATIPAATF